MEQIAHSIMMATAASVQPITKNTLLPISMVLVIIGATFYYAAKVTSTDYRMANVEASVERIERNMEVQQAAILEAIQK